MDKSKASHYHIQEATRDQRKWAAQVFAANDPWKALGIGLGQCLEMCNDPQFQVLIAQEGQINCGVIILDPCGFAGSPYVKSIAVSEAFRGKKVGARLLTYAEALFAHRRFMALCVSSFNEQAFHFYKHLGYEQCGVLEDYLIEGLSERVMIKRLK